MKSLSDQTNQGLSGIEQAICDLRAEGKTHAVIQEELGIDSKALWRMQRTNPAFAGEFARASEEGAEALGEVLLTLHETISDPKKAAVASNNYRFYLERRHRKKFGANMEVTGNVTVDIGDALAIARARALRPTRDLPPPIDVEFEALPSVAPVPAPDKQSEASEFVPLVPDIFS